MRHGKCGRKPLLSVKMQGYLARESRKNPRATARQIQKAVGGASAEASINTVKRALVRSGRLAYRPVKSPSWTENQMKTRLKWALKYRNWTVHQWKKVRKSYSQMTTMIRFIMCLSCVCSGSLF
jgi:hypothetical protein